LENDKFIPKIKEKSINPLKNTSYADVIPLSTAILIDDYLYKEYI
jgi:hypothetical protein